ncbi:hypothetical protein RF11_02026 [Thelohanellus kitauei]|uniref:Uncharacterized protein n=1 Tax=Thelohanellus kitauei TaxID=669202 RepID=A0A0C2JFI1_THEKT|nr:hypothetical protein RF11_02026 [Thelohanellus kitauei]
MKPQTQADSQPFHEKIHLYFSEVDRMECEYLLENSKIQDRELIASNYELTKAREQLDTVTKNYHALNSEYSKLTRIVEYLKIDLKKINKLIETKKVEDLTLSEYTSCIGSAESMLNYLKLNSDSENSSLLHESDHELLLSGKEEIEHVVIPKTTEVPPTTEVPHKKKKRRRHRKKCKTIT